MFIFQSADNNKQLGNITTVSLFLNHFSVISNRENITVCFYFNYFSIISKFKKTLYNKKKIIKKISNPGNIGNISAAPQSTQTPPNPPQSALSAAENSHRSNAAFNAIKTQIPALNKKKSKIKMQMKVPASKKIENKNANEFPST